MSLETSKRNWSEDWYHWKTGADCPFCMEGRPDAKEIGVRYYASDAIDAYLLNGSNAPGSTLVIWRGPHVNDPIDMSEKELTTYFLEIQKVARALDVTYQPIKISYVTVGSHVPHLHTAIVLRYDDDEAPNVFLLWKKGPYPYDEEALDKEAEALRRVLAGSPAR